MFENPKRGKTFDIEHYLSKGVCVCVASANSGMHKSRIETRYIMKLLSIAVPCYNSEAYMEHCVETLLVGGESVEIIIVDDGSKDRTAEIADRLATEHPNMIKAIHQENGGHGEAVNTGLSHATGMYFKVVDSDVPAR